MRPLSAATALALLTPAVALTLVTPAHAAAAPAKVVYGYAWASGATGLRITPASAVHQGRLYRLKAVPGAKELRLAYAQAAYRRVTTGCDLKETEGHLAVDGRDLGKTPCRPADLTQTLRRGPAPVRVEYTGAKAVVVTEFLAAPAASRVATGTVRRVDDSTVLFSRTGARTSGKLGYTFAMTFSRTTAHCRDGWLAGKPVNADKQGLGGKSCSAADFTEALKSARHPVRVKVDYVPGSGEIYQVWEAFADA
jgi:hypothetical protein